jgi:eukaryotic-like serine/threonine-protein kinase
VPKFALNVNLATTTEREAAQLAGQVLSGRYRVLEHIGQGAVGNVYLVEHVHVGRRYALKLLRPEHRASQAIQQRFRHEAKLGACLRSAYAVEVFDYDTWHGAPYLVMEHLEGSSLRSLLEREGPLPVLRAASLIREACRGVGDVHALGIVHRDLKPSNLFVCGARGGERCKVLDFGIAKHEPNAVASSTGPATATGAIVGTLAYMAPEQIRATPSLDARADVYALGAILYECLAGQPAFAAPGVPALMYKILEERPAPLAELRPELPRELVAIIERALACEREARFQSARELEQALSAFSHRSGGRPLLSDGDDTDVGEAAPVPPRAAWALTHRERRPTWNVAATIAFAAGMLGLVAGNLMAPERGTQVTTTLLAGQREGAALPAVQAPEAANRVAELKLPAAQSEVQAQPPATRPDVVRRRHGESGPPRAGAPRPPRERSSSIDGASGPTVDLERANPYRQKQ